MTRRKVFTQTRADEILRLVQRRIDQEKRGERKAIQYAETLAFYRALPLKRVYKWFDQGVSRTTIARRLGVPRRVITYAWDHRYDK